MSSGVSLENWKLQRFVPRMWDVVEKTGKKLFPVDELSPTPMMSRNRMDADRTRQWGNEPLLMTRTNEPDNSLVSTLHDREG